jgi:NAD+ synthase
LTHTAGSPFRRLNSDGVFRTFAVMETGKHSGDLALNTEIVRAMLTGFIRDETGQAGFDRVVLGLSGGIDSTLAAYLAVEALGSDRVTGVIMPYRSSNPESRADAELVVRNLGMTATVVDISPMVDAYLGPSGITDRLRAGNVMARQRMIVLYDRSSSERALVLGTSNKTELLLGYGTLHGDMACALNPLGDLYKTQVWQMARAVGVPDRIFGKPPSADLWQGQTDEGELGFTYAEADRLLFAMVDERRDDPALAALGFDPALVQRIREMIRRTQFKRRPPLIAKVSNRTVNVDFRYARDWGS